MGLSLSFEALAIHLSSLTTLLRCEGVCGACSCLWGCGGASLPGFHEKTPLLFDTLAFLLPFLDLFIPTWLPGFFIPTRGLRLVFNKIAQDFQNLPALGALMQVNSCSLWQGMPSRQGMPGRRRCPLSGPSCR